MRKGDWPFLSLPSSFIPLSEVLLFCISESYILSPRHYQFALFHYATIMSDLLSSRTLDPHREDFEHGKHICFITVIGHECSNSLQFRRTVLRHHFHRIPNLPLSFLPRRLHLRLFYSNSLLRSLRTPIRLLGQIRSQMLTLVFWKAWVRMLPSLGQLTRRKGVSENRTRILTTFRVPQMRLSCGAPTMCSTSTMHLTIRRVEI